MELWCCSWLCTLFMKKPREQSVHTLGDNYSGPLWRPSCWLGNHRLLWRLNLSSTLCATLLGFVPCLQSVNRLWACPCVRVCVSLAFRTRDSTLHPYIVRKIFMSQNVYFVQFEGKTMMTLARCCPNDGCVSEAGQRRPWVDTITKCFTESNPVVIMYI